MKRLFVEVADTPFKRELGLMDRKALGKDDGMLFKFPYKSNMAFWMKNTYIPLDIAFIDDDGKILQISEMYPLSTRSIRSNHPCRYALETNKGWFKENNLTAGSFVVMSFNKSRRTVIAQGFMDKLKNYLQNPMLLLQKKPKPNANEQEEKPQEQPQQQPPPVPDPTQQPQDPQMAPPESGVDGQGYPEGAYVQEQNPEVAEKRDLRGQIQLANDYNLKMEVVYWTLAGHILPPRKLMPLPGEGYSIKNGPKGDFLVAFDMSPSITGGEGWTIKGNQPKSFILDNIISLALINDNGQELTPEEMAKIVGKR